MKATTKSISCGRCKGTHATTEEVRLCHQVEDEFGPGPSEEEFQQMIGQVEVLKDVRPATDKQKSFIQSMKSEMGEELTEEELNVITFKDAKAMIPSLIKRRTEWRAQNRKPLAGIQVSEAPEVPEGYYAIEEEGTLKFFSVRHWAPKGSGLSPVVILSIQASSELHRIRDKKRILRILDSILEEGPAECAKRYGLELGRCGACNRTLTDELSRSLGIGPVCRERTGWF